MKRLVGAVVLLVGLTGCISGAGVQPRAAAPSTTVAASEDTSGLLEQRRAAGIADCPTSDPGVPARSDGLPDRTLDCLGADSRVRLAGLRGTPMVINVWAQWCGPCRAEAPFLAEAAGAYGERVDFLGIDFADPRPDLAITFADEAGWRYPQLVDADKSIAADLAIIGPPQTFFVSGDGRIVHRHVGPILSTAQLNELIRTHLEVS